ncbi:FAD dependent oxidoreductase-domain-containing protein [Xylariales sp. PMI_506]|nr:FAD dependent oxidoreductase-domain-containing protein [Xylariales sp. PMI_506]
MASWIKHLASLSDVSPEAIQAALDRIYQDPGIPGYCNENGNVPAHSIIDSGDDAPGTTPFWLKDPHPTVAKAQSAQLPARADYVIVGSGITGTAVAFHLLGESAYSNLVVDQMNGATTGGTPVVVMLEARDATSGATGRNGGHIIDDIADYSKLKEEHGSDDASRIQRFQLAHLEALLTVARKYGASVENESQIRRVEFAKVFLDIDTLFRDAVEVLEDFRRDMPDDARGFGWYEGDNAQKRFGIPGAHGVITGPAGALWPYKLITNILAELLRAHTGNFHLETNTPLLEIAIRDCDMHSDYPFELHTPRGLVRARHVLHCTNAHISNLVPGLRGRVFPLRGQMTAQTPGSRFPHQGDKRSWIIYDAEGYDYLTQLPLSPSPAVNGSSPATDCSSSGGEMMLGGALRKARNHGLQEFGALDDTTVNKLVGAHLEGMLESVFGPEGWGEVSEPHVKAAWTGIMGFTVDGQPWIGKLPYELTERKAVSSVYERKKHQATPAEWAAAGFSGQGMISAWLAGKALALMLLQHEGRHDVAATPEDDLSAWFPEPLRITDDRIRNNIMPRDAKDILNDLAI